MYDWLRDLPGDCSVHVVTPNRRLARKLRDAYASQRTDSGETAWRTPPIYAMQDWYLRLAETLPAAARVPVRINDNQSRLLWEECLRPSIDDPFVNVGALARLCRDAWQRLHDWCVPLERVQETAAGPDQYQFARAADRYAGTLRERGYVDGATLPAFLQAEAAAGRLVAPAGVLHCGFDRQTPRFTSLLAALRDAGATIRGIDVAEGKRPRLLSYADPDAELRAAGAWARAAFERDPARSIAIVVTRLEQQAQRSAGLIREGFMPGWQTASPRAAAAVDVSYGRRMVDLPAIHVALLALRWFQQPLAGADVGQLLRSTFVGVGDVSGRTRLELLLRDWPDREWHVDVLLQALAGRDGSTDAADWLARFRAAQEAAASGPAVRSPAGWAEAFERVLAVLNWPGEAPLGSEDFQLDNRWRKLLNEFSRLGLVSSSMHGREAVSRLAALAADSVFQPESTAAIVTVLGPLEAAGLEFDSVRVTGAIATDWPPASHAPALLSRDLQREYEMPDATPEDTARFAGRVLRRIVGAARDSSLSFARMIGDAEQVPTRLLGKLEVEQGNDDPGWFATRFADAGRIAPFVDRVPALRDGEMVAGGATTIQQQKKEPFTAFAYGRLRARPLREFTRGIAANVRGNLLHSALADLYADLPDRATLSGWTAAERADRIGRATDRAFRRVERFADDVLRQVLAIERQRTLALLAVVLEIDAARMPFRIESVEGRIDAVLGRVPLRLRSDRIDRLPDGSLAILDYKTGRARKFAGRDGPHDLQLVVYASVVADRVSGLALFNVDTREPGIEGAGPAFGGPADWQRDLDTWRGVVYRLADELAGGDVRLNAVQGLEDARALSVLSRYPEVYRGD